MTTHADRFDGPPRYRRGTSSFIALGMWARPSLLMWGLAWLSINTGPQTFTDYQMGLAPTIEMLRAALPLMIFVAGMIALPAARVLPPRPRSWAEKGFWAYGLVALLACSGASNWFDQAYWGFAFLGVLATGEIILRNRSDRLDALARLNILSWAATTAALILMLFLARDVLISPDSGNAYGFINRFHQARGFGMSRETGLSRMAVAPALIALVFMMSGRSWQRLLAGIVFAGSAYIIWIMQSRGALFSFLGAFTFVLLFGGRSQMNLAKILGITVAGIALILFVGTNEAGDVWMHITRNTGTEGFVTQSGRPNIWSDLLEESVKSPIWGFGPQADRLFGWNAQNALVYAFICGGVIGAACFLAAMASAWRGLLTLLVRARSLPERQRRMFQICGGMLVFYTLRSIPENSAAVFSIDLLLQYPAMLYLVELAHKCRDQSPNRLAANA